MYLQQILGQCDLPDNPNYHDVWVSGVVSDSRQVKPGYLFVALKGKNFDAHQFIPQALQRGAIAIVGMEPDLSLSVPYIRVADSRLALSRLAAAFHEYPAQKLTMIGVTGTDGKTTTTNLIYQIMLTAGLRVGMISTVNAVIGEQVLDTGFHVTTPDSPDIQRYLSMMVQSGLTHAILETTSHGWAQHRVDQCEFDIGVITNITHEHLDEHGSFEQYRAAKARLFSSLSQTMVKTFVGQKLGVLNFDDDSYEYLSSITQVPRISYGLSQQAQFHPQEIIYHPTGMSFIATGLGFRIPITSRLIGNFNISNLLASICVAVVGLDIDETAVQQGIAGMPGVPGRMEEIKLGQAFKAFVDFAHTPNALRCALETARGLTNGKIIAVFGSAGLRDRHKRKMMSAISLKNADLTILTAEDPRTESLSDILEEMAKGADAAGGKEGRDYWRVPDRADAIRLAVETASEHDLVIVCGKGHEQSMCFGNTEYPWDDRVALKAALCERLGIQGPQMPKLPTRIDYEN